MVVIHWLTQITNDPIAQRPAPDNLIRVCSHEDRRDYAPRVNEMSVELDSSHSRHMDVGDQAGGFSEKGRCQEIGCRRECFDGVAERAHELSHGLAERLIIIDDRDQGRFRHHGFQAAGRAHSTGTSEISGALYPPYVSGPSA
jgi:hypothetical protein